MSEKAKQRATDVAQMKEEGSFEQSNHVTSEGVHYNALKSRGGRPKGAQNVANRAGHAVPQAVGTFASGSVLGTVLSYGEDYLMVIPNPEFPSVVRMDLETAAFRINVCTEHRIFDARLTAKMVEVSQKSPNLGI